MTRDRDIRRALRTRLELTHEHESDTLVLDELSLCQGSARVDMAVVNGALHGYEIKSERDTLERLKGQAEVYGRALDAVTIVIGPRHLRAIETEVPFWWGIVVATGGAARVDMEEHRSATQNPSVDKFALAQLLWREEALDILLERGLAKGVMSKPRAVLWERIAELFDVYELGSVVRQRLKIRTNWRVDERPS